MAKDLNDLDVAVVAGHGELKVVSVHESYAALRAADHDAVVEEPNDFIRPPVAAVGRDAFLKQWSGAATKAKRLGASTSLLALAACGAGSDGKNYYHVTGALAETVNGREANDTINIDADLLEDDQLLTLQGESTMIVDNLVGDLSAEGLTGPLRVVAGDNLDDDLINITTGSADTWITGTAADDTITIDVDLLENDGLLTLDGASAMVVTGLIGDIDAAGLTGSLNVTTADNEYDDNISITTGSADTSITGTGADDTITVVADALENDELLTLGGASAMVVTGLIGDIDAAGLTGSLDVTTADNEDDDDITIATGSAAASITGTGVDDTITVVADDTGNATQLTLDGASAMVVTGLIGDINAAGLAGSLNVTTAGTGSDDYISIVMGENNATISATDATDVVLIDATSMDDDKTLVLTGASQVVVNHANETMTIDASNTLTNLLVVNADSEPGADTLTVKAGSSDVTMNIGDAGDTLIVEADAMANAALMTITGGAAATVNDVQSSITINGSAMTDTLVVNIIDETVGTAADTITIRTSTTDTTVNAADADDTVNINASALANDDDLTITGAAAVNVTDLIANIDAAALTGSLDVTTADNEDDDDITIATGSAATAITGTGADDTVTVSADALGNDTSLTLDGASAMVVTDLSGDIDATGLTGTLDVTTADNDVDGDITIATGSNNTTVNATGANDTVTVDATSMTDSKTLVLKGASDVTVNHANETMTIDASNILTGELVVNTDIGLGADTLTVNAGSSDTTLNIGDADDTLVVEADAMTGAALMTITGGAASTVNDVQSSITINGSTMTDTLVVNIINETVGTAADTITIQTSTTDTTVNAADSDDTVNIDASTLADDEDLTITGAAAVNVTNLVANISASTMTGDLAATIKAGGASTTIVAGSGDDTVTGSTSAERLSLTSVETVNALGGNDNIYMENASLRSADLGDGDDDLNLGNATASTTATVIGGSGSDTVDGSTAGDTLTLTTVEYAYGNSGADSYTVTDEGLVDTYLSGGNDTLTFADGGGLAAASFLDGGADTDTLNVTLSQNISYTASDEIINFENLHILDAGSTNGGFDVSITLDSLFDNYGAINFDASELDAGEVLTFNAQAYSALHEVSVTAGAGADVITTAEANAQRGLMTVDFSYADGDATHGGVDKLVIRDAAWDGEGLIGSGTQTFQTDFQTVDNSTTFGVEVLGFKAGANGDKIDVEYGSGATNNGGLSPDYRLGTGDQLVGLSTGSVIAIDSASYQLNSNSSWLLADVAAMLSNNGDGDALVGLHDGEYTVAIYSDDSLTADAHLFSIRVDGGDGLDFGQVSGQPVDTDMIEYIGVLREVGADALVGSNFV